VSSKRQTHNVIEKKRKDRLKLDIDDIRRLLPETVVKSKKQVFILYYKDIFATGTLVKYLSSKI